MKPIKKIFYSSLFERSVKHLPADLRGEVVKSEAIFRRDSFDARLKTHKLKGNHRDLWSFSITYKHHIVFRFISSDTVFFIDVGDHSIYK